MRILQLTGQMATVGGVSKYVQILTADLIRLGHECLILSAEDPRLIDYSSPVRYAPALKAQITDPQLEAIIEIASDFHPDALVLHHLTDVKILERFMREDYPTTEFVHTFICEGQKLFRRKDQLCRNPVSPRCLINWYLGPCGSQPDPAAALRAYRGARRRQQALRGLAGVFVGSEFMKDYLVGEGIGPDRIAVIPWVPPPVTRSPREHRRAEDDTCTILFVGRLIYQKGVQYLLRALQLLNQSFSLRIAGDGYYGAELKAASRRLGVSSRVEFLGTLSGPVLEREYSQASVLVVPSLLPEPLGLVVSEALSHELPVVVSDVGGLPEWRTRGYDVRTYPARDPQTLAALIELSCSSSYRVRDSKDQSDDDALVVNGAAETLAAQLEILCRRG